MAIVEVKVPQLSESVAEATLLSWKKKPGEAVAIDEILIEIETDKVVLEVPAPAAGVLAAHVVADGGTVVSDQVIAQIDTEGKAGAAAAPAAVAPAAAPVAVAAAPAATGGSKGDVAMPAAAKLLADNGLAVGDVAGSGKDGRVTKGDVLAAVAGGAKPAAVPAPVAAPVPAAVAKPLPAVAAPTAQNLGDRPEQRVPMSRLRARIAERLIQSQSTNAILTTFNEVNMAPVMDMRKKFQDKFEKEHGIKLGFMSFFVKAAVAALKKYPVLNASVDGNDIVYHEFYDIGVAVSTDRGLVVPVLRDADTLGFGDIEKAVVGYATRAREGSITLEELTGGTFTITNGGVFGSLLSTPILNMPQSAILGMHKIQERPVVVDGQVVVRPMMYLALSYDHRIIDGRDAVQFLVAVKDALEDPARLLLQV